MSKIEVKTYKEVFEVILGIKFDEKLQKCVKYLETEDYDERSIVYAIYTSQDKLSIYIGDPRFFSILQNEVRKIAHTKTYWREYWAKKDAKKKSDTTKKKQPTQTKK